MTSINSILTKPILQSNMYTYNEDYKKTYFETLELDECIRTKYKDVFSINNSEPVNYNYDVEIQPSWSLENIASIQPPKSWEELFQLEMSNLKYIDSILNKLYETGNNILPSKVDIFKPFEYCNLDNLKVIIFDEECYTSSNLSTGIPFMTNDNSVSKKLKTIYESIGHSKVDFKSWGEQGVLLLNYNMTVVENEYKSNNHIWKPFFHTMFNYLDKDKYIFVFIGKSKRLFDEFQLNDKNNNFVFEASFTFKVYPRTLFDDINYNLTQRKVSDFLNQLKTNGVISKKEIDKIKKMPQSDILEYINSLYFIELDTINW